jgi:hypothetical protein
MAFFKKLPFSKIVLILNSNFFKAQRDNGRVSCIAQSSNGIADGKGGVRYGQSGTQTGLAFFKSCLFQKLPFSKIAFFKNCLFQKLPFSIFFSKTFFYKTFFKKIFFKKTFLKTFLIFFKAQRDNAYARVSHTAAMGSQT